MKVDPEPDATGSGSSRSGRLGYHAGARRLAGVVVALAASLSVMAQGGTIAAAQAPQVIGTAPVPGAVNVPLGTTVRVTFSEPMDQAATQAAFTMVPRMDLRTPYETTGALSTAAAEQAFLSRLDSASDRVRIVELARTSPNNYPVQLVVVGPAQSRSQIASRRSILHVCSQHGDEPAPREACLIRARDHALADSAETLLIIPSANPEGIHARTRGNAQGVDLNRDHLNLSTVEARAIARVMRDYRPDVVGDQHESIVTPESQLLMISNPADAHPNVFDPIEDLQTTLRESFVIPRLRAAGFSPSYYHDGSGEERRLVPVAALKNIPSILIETSRATGAPTHWTLAKRVEAQRLTMEAQLAMAVETNVDASLATAEAQAAARGGAGGYRLYFTESGSSYTDSPPRGYQLTSTQFNAIRGDLDSHGIRYVPSGTNFTVWMNQTLMPWIPLVLDSRAGFNEQSGTPLTGTPPTLAAPAWTPISDPGPTPAGNYSWSGNTLTFDPASDLAPETRYEARVGTGARAATGEPLATPHGWEFTTSAATSGGNLARNPSFETDLAGWGTYQASASRVSVTSAPDGAWVARVTHSTGSSYTLTQANVATATTGSTYVAAAHVRAATSSAVGKPIRVTLREQTPAGTVVRDVAGSSTLSSSFKRVSVALDAPAPGNVVSVRIGQLSAVAGDAFDADAVSIVRASTVMGNATAGAVWTTMTPNIKRASAAPLSTGSPVDVAKLRAYVDGRAATSGSTLVRGLVYTDAGGVPGTLIARTPEVSVAAGSSARWIDLRFASPPRLAPGKYWLSLHSGGSTAARYAAVTRTVALRGNNDSYADGATSPYGSTTVYDKEISLYAVGG